MKRITDLQGKEVPAEKQMELVMEYIGNWAEKTKEKEYATSTILEHVWHMLDNYKTEYEILLDRVEELESELEEWKEYTQELKLGRRHNR